MKQTHYLKLEQTGTKLSNRQELELIASPVGTKLYTFTVNQYGRIRKKTMRRIGKEI